MLRQSIHTLQRKLVSGLIQTRNYNDSKRFLQNPQAVRVSWLKAVIIENLPFTNETLSTRGGLLNSMSVAVSFCKPESAKVNEKGQPRKRVDDSWLELILPFSEHESLKYNMVKTDDKTMRYGKLFEILDALAADVSYRHCGGKQTHLTIVTASVDGMKLYEPINLDHDLRLQAYLSYVGRSSMEVTIDMVAVCDKGISTLMGTTQFIMVARTNEAAAEVPGLDPGDNTELQQTLVEGGLRSKARRQRALASLEVTPPLPQEATLVHQLYLRSLQKQQLADSTTPPPSTTTQQQQESSVHNALEGNANIPLVMWMDKTRFSNTQFMHRQDRNIHGKIFGGHIMQQAFELAWVAATCFLGPNQAQFMFVGDIQFVRPVNIGAILEFSARVVYSDHDREGGGLIVVQAAADEVDPTVNPSGSHSRIRTNRFSYVFQSKSGAKCPEVLPRSYEETVAFLDGRRVLTQLMIDVDDDE